MRDNLPQLVFFFMVGLVLAAGIGVAVAFYLHRRTTLSALNVYLAWLMLAPLASYAIYSGGSLAVVGAYVLTFATWCAAAARRWRLGALGAGGELRQYERARRWVWQRRTRPAQPGRRDYITGQGELVRDRKWPAYVASMPMTADGRAQIPVAEGRHLFFVGATGSGKTTSARRWLLARGLNPDPMTGLIVLDPKGDPGLEHDLRAIAATRDRPFVLFDTYHPATDRWNPIWADDPGAVVARLVAPVEADSDSDASHYSRVLLVRIGLHLHQERRVLRQVARRRSADQAKARTRAAAGNADRPHQSAGGASAAQAHGRGHLHATDGALELPRGRRPLPRPRAGGAAAQDHHGQRLPQHAHRPPRPVLRKQGDRPHHVRRGRGVHGVQGPHAQAQDDPQPSQLRPRRLRLRGQAEARRLEPGIDRPSVDASNPDFRFLDAEQLAAILRAVPNDALGAMEGTLYRVAVMTGLRQGELVALRWRDVDWTARKVRVRQNYTRGEWGTPKSRRSTRTVPLADTAAAALEHHFQRSAYQGDDDLVFGHPHTGRPYDASKMRKRFYDAMRGAGLGHLVGQANGITFHSLRHTYSTRMAAVGVPMRTLQEWMGHKDFATTLKYADCAPDPAQGAAFAELAFGAAGALSGSKAGAAPSALF